MYTCTLGLATVVITLGNLASFPSYSFLVYNYDTMTREVLLYIGGRGLVSQIIEPVTFARCAFIIALRNIALDGYLDTRRNCAGTRLYR